MVVSHKNELWPTFPKIILGHPEVVLQSLRLLIYHLKLKQLYLGNGCSDRKNNDIFDPTGVKESLIGQF